MTEIKVCAKARAQSDNPKHKADLTKYFKAWKTLC